MLQSNEEEIEALESFLAIARVIARALADQRKMNITRFSESR